LGVVPLFCSSMDWELGDPRRPKVRAGNDKKECEQMCIPPCVCLITFPQRSAHIEPAVAARNLWNAQLTQRKKSERALRDF
jgi:hypothetical protein